MDVAQSDSADSYSPEMVRLNGEISTGGPKLAYNPYAQIGNSGTALVTLRAVSTANRIAVCIGTEKARPSDHSRSRRVSLSRERSMVRTSCPSARRAAAGEAT